MRFTDRPYRGESDLDAIAELLGLYESLGFERVELTVFLRKDRWEKT